MPKGFRRIASSDLALYIGLPALIAVVMAAAFGWRYTHPERYKARASQNHRAQSEGPKFGVSPTSGKLMIGNGYVGINPATGNVGPMIGF